MVYGEVGTPPLIVNIKSKVLLFWSSLIICDEIINVIKFLQYYIDYYLICFGCLYITMAYV